MRSTSLPVGGSWTAALWTIMFSTGFGPPSGGGGGFSQGGFGPQSSQNPYSQPPGMLGPPPKKSNLWIWILGIVGVGGLVVCGCCGGVMMFGLSTMSGGMKEEVAGHPAIQQHLGEIQSMSLNFTATGEEAQKRGNGKNTMVYDVKGSAGDGQLIGEQAVNPEPGHMFDKIDLRLESGEVISIK